MNLAHKAFLTFIVFLLISTSFWVYDYSKNQPGNLDAIKFEPLSVNNWVKLADELHRSNSQTKRNTALNVATDLASRRAIFTMPIWYRHIAWSEFEDARKSASQLISLDPSYTYDVFLVMKNIYGVKDFLDNIISKELVSTKQNHHTHLSILISDLIKNNKMPELLEVWDNLDDKNKSAIAQSRYMLNHYQSLSRKNQFNIIDTFSTSPKSNRQFIGSNLVIPFDKNDSQNPFCWIRGIQKNTLANNKSNILSLSITPIKSANSIFICYIPVIVEQEMSILVSSLWSAKDLDKDQVSSLRIGQIGKNKIKPLRLIKKGSWQTERINYPIVVNEHTLGIEIVFAAPRSEVDMKTGQISLSSFNITRQNKN